MFTVFLFTAGCASPGPPRAPSLRLPKPVRDLSAERVGDAVELRFTVPQSTTDNLPIREAEITGAVCREEAAGRCEPIAGGPRRRAFPVKTVGGQADVAEVREDLPESLRAGPARPLGYRVEFFNANGRSAGASAVVLCAAGSAPAAVQDLRVEGTRLGARLRWLPQVGGGAGEEVLIERETVGAGAAAPGTGTETPGARTGTGKPPAPKPTGLGVNKPDESAVVWMDTKAAVTEAGQPARDAGETLDGTAREGVAYMYRAQRRRRVMLLGQALQQRSAISAPVEFTLVDTFPPLPPAGLSAAAFHEADGKLAVDLVWKPVDDTALAGYEVSRVSVDGAGVERGEPTVLTPEPVRSPAFHDTNVAAGQRFLYRVIAIDEKGNRSAAARVLLGAAP